MGIPVQEVEGDALTQNQSPQQGAGNTYFITKLWKGKVKASSDLDTREPDPLPVCWHSSEQYIGALLLPRACAQAQSTSVFLLVTCLGHSQPLLLYC